MSCNTITLVIDFIEKALKAFQIIINDRKITLAGRRRKNKSFFLFILRQTFRIGKTTTTFEVSFLITSHFKHKKKKKRSSVSSERKKFFFVGLVEPTTNVVFSSVGLIQPFALTVTVTVIQPGTFCIAHLPANALRLFSICFLSLFPFLFLFLCVSEKRTWNFFLSPPDMDFFEKM